MDSQNDIMVFIHDSEADAIFYASDYGMEDVENVEEDPWYMEFVENEEFEGADEYFGYFGGDEY